MEYNRLKSTILKEVSFNELQEKDENIPEGTIIHVEFVKEGDDDDGK